MPVSALTYQVLRVEADPVVVVSRLNDWRMKASRPKSRVSIASWRALTAFWTNRRLLF
jgi:hypothetical protein